MSVFKSFLMGGFECADHINRSGQRINLLKETQHDVRVEEDYHALSLLGIKVVREGICWSEVERSPGFYDFSEVKNRISCAEKYGIQQIWDLIHFGYPDGLFPTHPLFCDRFTALCSAFADLYSCYANQRLMVVPVNEISFLAWHSGDVRGTVPFAVNSGWDIKYHLCKAAILGIKALRDILPDCCVMLVEPLVKVHPVCDEDSEHVFHMNEHQHQAMDIILGRICPELGGSPDLADILGFNYYWNCQWKHTGEELPWPEQAKSRVELNTLLQSAYERYGKKMFLSETGHFGTGRVEWLTETLLECRKAMDSGVPLLGMCIYPVTDRPDWDNLSVYHDCGIFDLDRDKNRIPHPGSIKVIGHMQKIIGHQKQKMLKRNDTLLADVEI